MSVNINNTKKNYIFGDHFLLQNDTARRLYFDYAASMPIIDYHNHLPVDQIAEDYAFRNMTDIWLKGDHYKWRAMRTLGVEEKYITGNASDAEKFKKWAEIVPETLRNPLFHWTHLELRRPFGIEKYLNKDTAEEIYKQGNDSLRDPQFSTRGLLKYNRVKTICTTDDPCDTLHSHQRLKESDFDTRVLPGFRPDPALHIFKTNHFRTYIEKLSEAADQTITDFDSLVKALENRIDYFHEHGGRVADHGLNYIPFFDLNKIKETDGILKKVLGGAKVLSDADAGQFTAMLLFHLCKKYNEKGWVQQFHLGPLRNVNTKKLDDFGPDTGFDSIGDYKQGLGLASFLDQLEKTGNLGKTILYNVNPSDNELFATMPGNFNEGPGKGKIQYGAAWWFMDQLEGMERQMNALSNMGILSCFVGMLTDSRSFLSFSRHDYFRRLLCNIMGKEMEAGLLPRDEKWIGGMIENICYNNAKEYFSFIVD